MEWKTYRIPVLSAYITLWTAVDSQNNSLSLKAFLHRQGQQVLNTIGECPCRLFQGWYEFHGPRYANTGP